MLGEKELGQVAARVRKLCQESVISFPKSPGCLARSPRYLGVHHFASHPSPGTRTPSAWQWRMWSWGCCRWSSLSPTLCPPPSAPAGAPGPDLLLLRGPQAAHQTDQALEARSPARDQRRPGSLPPSWSSGGAGSPGAASHGGAGGGAELILPSQPLDQVTCIHNCLDQLDTHTR